MSQIHKRFRIKKEIDLSSVSDLPHIVTLMMFRDAIMSSVRWCQSQNDSTEFTASTDRLFSVVIGAGWAAESIRVMKDMKKKI